MFLVLVLLSLYSPVAHHGNNPPPPPPGCTADTPRLGKPGAGDFVVVSELEWLRPSQIDQKRGFRQHGGGSGCLKLPSRRQSRGALITELPNDAGPTACGPLGPVPLPSLDSERTGCLYVPPPLLHHPLPSSLHPVALLLCSTHSALPLVELPLGE